jgi:hypothetical protein
MIKFRFISIVFSIVKGPDVGNGDETTFFANENRGCL